MTKYTCAIDYFGVAGNALIQALLRQDTNKRARRVAMNNLVRLGKASGLIEKSAVIHEAGIMVLEGGGQELVFLDKRHEVEIPS